MTINHEDLDLDALEATARAATPGPWMVTLGAAWQVETHAPDWEMKEVASTGPDGSTGSEDDAIHIAAFDPPTALALIARLREAEEAIENTSHIHGPRKVWENDRAYTLVCTVCVTEQYPCATVRTLSRYKPTTENGSDHA